jgi:hypothetical protein
VKGSHFKNTGPRKFVYWNIIKWKSSPKKKKSFPNGSETVALFQSNNTAKTKAECIIKLGFWLRLWRSFGSRRKPKAKKFPIIRLMPFTSLWVEMEV